MARPKKQGLLYFPLDTDIFENRKIKNLRRAHGLTGILTYLNLLCRVYRNGYYYKFDDIEELSMDIAEEIANAQLKSTATGVTETINYLVGRGILDEGLFEQGIISGVALQEQYVLSAYKARRNIEMDVYQLVDVLSVIQKNKISYEETEVISEETEVIPEEGTQSKSKIKDKVNNIDSHIFSISFNNVRACARELGTTVDPKRFWAYYQARGWKIDGQPIHDWKALLLSWDTKGEPKMKDDSKEYTVMAGLLAELEEEDE
ncbi:MAG: DUF4373 domain-containing protein [Ruminococcaceae bacterium]|nr:DUF4373 domain-containing protein [Oscillospiraceae bacterium]